MSQSEAQRQWNIRNRISRRRGHDTPLLARARAAQQLVRDGDLDPHDALALTVWPTRDLTDPEQGTA